MVSSEGMASDQVEWNMANLLNIELSNLRQQANRNFVSGRYNLGIDSLVAMKMTGVHAMDQNERAALTTIEKEIEKHLIDFNKSNSLNDEDRRRAAIASLFLRRLFLSYSELLMDILHAHGFLGSYKKDGARMKI